MVKFNKLEEDNVTLRSELTASQEKCQNIQREYEAEQATSKQTADLAESLQEKLDNELKRVENLGKTLDDEHANLKQIQKTLNEAQQENTIIKVNILFKVDFSLHPPRFKQVLSIFQHFGRKIVKYSASKQ